MAACRRYIGGEFLAALMARCQEVLGPAGAWSLSVSALDPNVVQFRYPASAPRTLAYVVPQVVLELGTMRSLCHTIVSRFVRLLVKNFPI